MREQYYVSLVQTIPKSQPKIVDRSALRLNAGQSHGRTVQKATLNG
jgi:hypothetical protein